MSRIEQKRHKSEHLQQAIIKRCLDEKQKNRILSWGLDLSHGLLYVFFGHNKRQKIVFRIQIMGILDNSENTLSWSWGQSFPGHLTRAVCALRRVARRENWADCSHSIIDCDLPTAYEYGYLVCSLFDFSFFLPLEVEKNRIYIVLCQ
jgi:hypothetical protein